MAKQRLPDYSGKDRIIELIAMFQGDKCITVRVSRPELSAERIRSMGIRLRDLAFTMLQKEQFETDMQEVDKTLHSMMYGDKS